MIHSCMRMSRINEQEHVHECCSIHGHECSLILVVINAGARDIHDMDINVTFLLSSYMPMNDARMNVWVTKTSKSE